MGIFTTKRYLGLHIETKNTSFHIPSLLFFKMRIKGRNLFRYWLLNGKIPVFTILKIYSVLQKLAYHGICRMHFLRYEVEICENNLAIFSFNSALNISFKFYLSKTCIVQTPNVTWENVSKRKKSKIKAQILWKKKKSKKKTE